MRSITNQFEKRDTYPKITVTDGSGNAIKFGKGGDYGRIYEVSLSADIDSDSWTADMSFRNHPDMENLDPHATSSDFNDGTIATQLMDRYHDVKVELSKDDGSTFANLFEGFVGEVGTTRTIEGDDVLDFSPYDKSKPLKDVPILEDAPNQPYEYYNIDAFDCADQILSDMGYSLTINRTASDNPSKTITEYKVKNTNVWDSLKEIFAQTGYKLMFRWASGTSQFDLVTVDPDRGTITSLDHTFTKGYDLRRVDTDDKDVRSQVVVFYVDRDSEKRDRVTVSDSTTKSNYGAPDFSSSRIHRTMVLKEDDKSLIDTSTEATAYANDALNDLKEPTPEVEIEFPYIVPGIELYDKLEFGGSSDYTVQVGVTSIDHELSVEDKIGSTAIRGTADRIIGEKQYWLNKGQLPDDIDAQKGDRSAPPKPANPPRLEKTTYVDDTGTTRAKVVCYGEHSQAWDVEGYQFRYRVKNTSTGNVDEWKYPDQIKNPQKTITGLEVGSNLELQVEYSAIDWENTEWSGLPGDSPYSDTGTIGLYVDITPPSAPSNLTATADLQGIALEWDKPTTSKDGSTLTDLNNFILYWNSTGSFDIDSADGYKDMGKSEAFTQNLPANTTRHYKITAVDNSGNESLPSSEASATADAPTDVDISAYNWSSDLTFSSTDSDTVSWESGTLTASNGDSYSINSGNTGNMGSTTYIYFDGDTSTTDLQTTTTASTAVGENQILIAVAENDADGARFQVFGGQGGQFITAEVVAADTMTFNELAGNSVRAAEADLDSIFAEDITVTGTIESDDYGANTGWKIGDNGVAIFNEADIRGSLNASDIDAGSLSISYITGEGDLAHQDDVRASSSEIYIDSSLEVSGNLYCAGGSVKMGQGVTSGGGDGILVTSGGKIQVTDNSGRVVFDSSGDFNAATIVPSDTFYSGTTTAGNTESIKFSDSYSAITERKHLVFIECFFNDSSGYARLRFHPTSTVDNPTDTGKARGTACVEIDASKTHGYIFVQTDNNSNLYWKCADTKSINLTIESAIPISL